MHGHAYGAPPQPPVPPSSPAIIGLRVLFVALPVLSCGFLSWATALRTVLVSRRARDWVAFGAVLALQTTAFTLFALDPGGDTFTTWRGDAGMAVLLLTMAGVVAHHLVVDITVRRDTAASRQLPLPPPYPPQHLTVPQYGGQPAPPAGPYTSTPGAPRIEQVRAELDDLSEMLRREEGQGR